MTMKLNLTGFAEEYQHAKGRPMELPILDVAEDPEQPRKEFNPVAMQELADSVSARGVKTPISVHVDPARSGKYIVNHGTRRLRASLLAGKTTIPAFVDEVYDAYDQVIENLQRENLTPTELAMFIAARVAAGDKKSEIAKHFGKGIQFITEHLALASPPACVEEAYAKGVTSPKTLYDLRRLYEQYPAQVEGWCATAPDISRRTVSDLAEALRHDVKTEIKSGHEEQGNLRHDVKGDAVQSPQVPELALVEKQDLTTHQSQKFRHDVEAESMQAGQGFVTTKFQMPAALSEEVKTFAACNHISFEDVINRALKDFFKL